MNAYIDTIKVTDENGEKSILYPRTKQEAVEGLEERLVKLEVADITETEDTTLENSNAGRLLFTEINGAMEQGANPSPTNPQEIGNVLISGIKTHKKNFADFQNAQNRDKSKFTYTTETAQKIVATRNADAGAFVARYSVNLKANITYKISLTENAYQVYLYYDELWGSVWKTFSNANDITITPPKDGVYIVGIYVPKTFASEITVSNLMIREDGTDATYEPYTESVITFSQPIDIYGLDDVRDILTSKQIKRKYAKFVFDGTEDGITLSTTTTGGGYYFRIPLSGIKPNINGNSKANALCTRLTQYTPNYLWENDVDGFSIDTQTPDTQRIRFRLTSLTDVVSVDALKAKLAEWYAEGKPLAFVLELATETTEELPLADQIALNSLQTFDGITYVDFISEIKPTFSAKYGTTEMGGMTLESLLTARSNDLRLSALETSVVNNI